MFQEMAEALSLFTVETLLFIFVGVLIGLLVGIIPGLGGLFALALLVPLTYTMEPFAAFGLLLATTAVINTGNTVTGVLFGIPGSAGGVATILDGHEMAKKGMADRALSAGFVASAVGGVIGAFVLALSLPVIRPVVLAFGSAQFFALILFALIVTSQLGEGDRLKSLLAGTVGLFTAMIGQESSTATLRYTFDTLYLWTGISLVPAIIGLFAVAEMMLLMRRGTPIATQRYEEAGAGRGGRSQGVLDVLRRPRLVASSSTIGTFVGALPGLGAETAQFVAYAHASKTSKNRELFGTGEVEGLIAPEAANNSKDGGSLIPTLLFGIPGSAPHAILLTTLLILGVQPGKAMVEENLHITWFLILILILSNLLGTAIMLAFSRQLSRFTLVKPGYLAPLILSVAVVGGFAASAHVGDILTVLGFGVLGYLMALWGYSRTTFTIGMVLGVFFEQYYLLTMQIDGIGFVLDPIVLAILGTTALFALAPTLRRRRRRGRRG